VSSESLIKGSPGAASRRAITNIIAEPNVVLRIVLAMAGVTTIYSPSWLIPTRIYTWIKAYTMDMASSLVVLLRVLRRSGGKLLFYCLHGCTPKPMFYKHTVLDWEYAQMLRYQLANGHWRSRPVQLTF
jgi:hypothetical protein